MQGFMISLCQRTSTSRTRVLAEARTGAGRGGPEGPHRPLFISIDHPPNRRTKLNLLPFARLTEPIMGHGVYAPSTGGSKSANMRWMGMKTSLGKPKRQSRRLLGLGNVQACPAYARPVLVCTLGASNGWGGYLTPIQARNTLNPPVEPCFGAKKGHPRWTR
jgi:hypothetical protein